MGFLFWTFAFFFSVWVFFRLFGRTILQFFLRTVLKQVAKDMDTQYRAYQRNYSRSAYHDSLHVNDEIRVDTPTYTKEEELEINEIAEDIEFEE